MADLVEKVKLNRIGSSHVTPSLVNSALSIHGTIAAFPHLNDVITVDMSNHKVESLECRHCDGESTIMQVKVLAAGDLTIIVAGTIGGVVKIWDAETLRLITTYTLPMRQEMQVDRQNYAKGIEIVKTSQGYSLIVGTNFGNLHVFVKEGVSFLHENVQEEVHKDPIADIATNGKEGDLTVEGCRFAVADEAGNISVWSVAPLIPILSFKAVGESLTAVCMRNDLVIASTMLGKILIFSQTSEALTCEISAHTRSITAICMHPTRDLVASVSEDTYINIWNLEGLDSKEIEAIKSISVKDLMICGVQFFGDEPSNVAALGYDVEAIHVISGSSIAA
mmetsp:Transcript_13019/g.45767  ORF Transcript_13019/g.45767 Transcript_13019/m.45767 type:complete len:336 (-) Transcript_13019:294-1301(-)